MGCLSSKEKGRSHEKEQTSPTILAEKPRDAPGGDGTASLPKNKKKSTKESKGGPAGSNSTATSGNPFPDPNVSNNIAVTSTLCDDGDKHRDNGQTKHDYATLTGAFTPAPTSTYFHHSSHTNYGSHHASYSHSGGDSGGYSGGGDSGGSGGDSGGGGGGGGGCD